MGSLQQSSVEPGIALLRLDRLERRNELLEVFQRRGPGLPQRPD